jgi:hypothetical protein
VRRRLRGRVRAAAVKARAVFHLKPGARAVGQRRRSWPGLVGGTGPNWLLWAGGYNPYLLWGGALSTEPQ